ncbi:MAG: apolipoprotein N-acyltransferase [Bradymonadales bacterium]|nr:apolipoprotein N-acyltransferase [Bradymonadales bacterium]
MKRVLLAPLRPLVAMVRQPVRTLACTLSALLVVFSFPRFDVYPLLFVAYIPLLAVVTRVQPRKAFFWGWLTGTITVLFGFYFIRQLLEVFGGLPGWISILLHLLFSLFQGIHVAAFAALVSHLSGDWRNLPIAAGKEKPAAARGEQLPSPVTLRRFPLTLTAPLAFVLVELVARAVYIFPYHIGNATYLFTTFIQAADLTGVLGLTAMVLLVNATLYGAGDALVRRLRKRPVERWPWRSALVTALLLLFCLIYGTVRIGQVDRLIAQSPTIRIGLVEADIGIFMKANPQRVSDNLLIHQNMSAHLASLGADLILWPETAVNIPFVAISTAETDDLVELEDNLEVVDDVPRQVTYFRPSPAELVEHVQQDRQRNTPALERGSVQRGFSTPLLFGVLTTREPTAEEIAGIPPQGRRPPRFYYNTAILVDAEGRVLGAYDKNVLLMFGEYVPLSHFLYRTFGFNFFSLVPTAGDVTPGEGVTVLELPFATADGQEIPVRIGAMICYEDIIAGYGLELAELSPNLFVNLINDGWFQTSSAAHHHMAFSVFRSVEHRLPLVRSTNTGVSSMIDPVGRILAQSWLVGAATRVEDAYYELAIALRRDERLADHAASQIAERLAALSGRLKQIQAELVQVVEAIDPVPIQNRSAESLPTVSTGVLGDLVERLEAVIPQLSAIASELVAIRAESLRRGTLMGDMDRLLSSSEQFVRDVLVSLEPALGQLREAKQRLEEAPTGDRWSAVLPLLTDARLALDQSQRMLSGPEYLIADVAIMPPPSTLYSKVGDLFAWLAALAVAAMFGWNLRARFKRRKATRAQTRAVS